MTQQKLVVLFTCKKSFYAALGANCFDENRNAKTFNDKRPVIAHPPCGSWGRLKAFCNHSAETKDLAPWSIALIQKNGGVLEHPAGSSLWQFCNLPLPGQGYDSYNGFSISINQSWFGHEAKKDTWLYIVGITKKELPAIPLSFDAIQKVISTSRSNNRKGSTLKSVSKIDRELTPLKLCIWLLNVLELIQKKNT